MYQQLERITALDGTSDFKNRPADGAHILTTGPYESLMNCLLPGSSCRRRRRQYASPTPTSDDAAASATAASAAADGRVE